MVMAEKAKKNYDQLSLAPCWWWKKSKQAFNVVLLFSFLAFITNQSCETALFGLVALKFSLIRIT